MKKLLLLLLFPLLSFSQNYNTSSYSNYLSDNNEKQTTVIIVNNYQTDNDCNVNTSPINYNQRPLNVNYNSNYNTDYNYKTYPNEENSNTNPLFESYHSREEKNIRKTSNSIQDDLNSLIKID